MYMCYEYIWSHAFSINAPILQKNVETNQVLAKI